MPALSASMACFICPGLFWAARWARFGAWADEKHDKNAKPIQYGGFICFRQLCARFFGHSRTILSQSERQRNKSPPTQGQGYSLFNEIMFVFQFYLGFHSTRTGKIKISMVCPDIKVILLNLARTIDVFFYFINVFSQIFSSH